MRERAFFDVPSASQIFRRRGSGFTLLEIMMVLALLALMAGLFITASRNFSDESSKIPEDIFWEVVTEARKRALLSGRDVRVHFMEIQRDEPAALVVTEADGTEARFPFATMGDVKLDFLSMEKSRSAILVGGEMMETQTLKGVTFYGDGTCTPFRLQLRTGTGPARRIGIDPWTCAEVLPKKESGA